MKRFLGITMLFLHLNLHAQNFLPVIKDGKWGFIDTLGNVLIEPQYQNVGAFSDDNCTVCEEYSCGLLNKKRGIIVPVQFRNVINVYDNLFIVTNSKNRMSYYREGWDIDSLTFYDEITTDNQGLGILLLNNHSEQKSRIYYKNQLIITPKIVSVAKFKEFLLIGDGNFYGLIDLDGEIMHPMKYESIEAFNKDSYVLVKGEKYGLFTAGQELLKVEYDAIQKNIFDNEVIAKKNNKVGIYNIKDLEWNFEVKYPHIECFLFQEEQLYEVYYTKSKVTLFNAEKDVLYQGKPNVYSIKSQDVVLFKEGEQWRFSSIKYKTINLLFDRVSEEKDGFYLVGKDQKQGLVNKFGKLVLKPEFVEVAMFENTIRSKRANGEVTIYSFGKSYVLTILNTFKKFKTLTISNNDNSEADFENFKFGKSFGPDSNPKIKTETSPDEEVMLGKFSYAENNNLKCLYSEDQKKCLTGFLFSIVDLNAFNVRNEKYARVVFPSGRMGMVSNRGSILATMDVKKDPKKDILEVRSLGFISPFDSNGLAKFNVNVPIMKRGVKPKEILKGNRTFGGKSGRWGIINKEGEIIIQPYYKSITSITNNQVHLQNKKGFFGVISLQKDTIVPFKFNGFIKIEKEGKIYYKSTINHSKWAVYNNRGVSITDAKYQKVAEAQNDGYLGVRRELKWTIIDSLGQEINAPIFQRIGIMNDGLVPVRYNNRWGYLSNDGELKVKYGFGAAETYAGGVMAVKVKGKYGIIDADSNWIVKPKFSKIYDNKNGFLIVKPKQKKPEKVVLGEKPNDKPEKPKGKIGLMNAEGKWVIAPIYKGLKFINNDFLIADMSRKTRANISRKRKLYNMEGKKLSNKFFATFKVEKNHTIVISKKKEHTVLNKEGEELFYTKKKYKEVKNYYKGTVQVRKGSSWYLVDSTDKTLLKGKSFKKMYPMIDGLMLVQDQTEYYYTDINGEKRIPGSAKANYGKGLYPSGQGVVSFSNSVGKLLFTKKANKVSEFNGDMAVLRTVVEYKRKIIRGVEKNIPVYKYSLMNNYGFDLSLPIYSKFQHLNNGVTLVRTSAIFGLFDSDMNELITPKYESIELVSETILKVSGGSKIGYYNISTGSWIWNISG